MPGEVAMRAPIGRSARAAGATRGCVAVVRSICTFESSLADGKGAAMTPGRVIVDQVALREQVREKYREVATHPDGEFHFHTGRSLATRCGYAAALVDALPDEAVESFAGVACPFALRSLTPGEHVVDVGSGAGMDSFLAAETVGPEGRVVGVEMTPEMLRALGKWRSS